MLRHPKRKDDKLVQNGKTRLLLLTLEGNDLEQPMFDAKSICTIKNTTSE
jgi:hypothetical protein